MAIDALYERGYADAIDRFCPELLAERAKLREDVEKLREENRRLRAEVSRSSCHCD